MSRPLRLTFPGGVHHVYARGNERREIFRDPADRRGFLALMAEVSEQYAARCHAYCLMDNHYHLLIETSQANLSDAVRQLNGVHAQRFNRRHGRSGHLFEGRFRSPLVDTDQYLLEAIRYVVLNPVRAGSVRRAEDWIWSSHRAMAGLAEAPKFLAVEGALALFGPDFTGARAMYRRFVDDGLISQQKELAMEPVNGSLPFIRALEPRLREHRDDLELARRERFMARPSLAEIFSAAASREARRRAMQAARSRHGYRLREIAEHLGVHYSTVSRGQVLK